MVFFVSGMNFENDLITIHEGPMKNIFLKFAALCFYCHRFSASPEISEADVAGELQATARSLTVRNPALIRKRGLFKRQAGNELVKRRLRCSGHGRHL
jgi:hypothetical protein